MVKTDFRIGSVALKNNLILAPLAGYTDVAFRRLCLECGAGLAVTEIVSVKGLLYRNAQTFGMLRTSEIEKPSCVQLFGSDPADFSAVVRSGLLDKFDIIDVNMGCPVNKVVKNGEGSALLRRPDVAADIVKTLVESGKPITVKMRSGFGKGEDVAVPFALAMQKAGASMITVHARTAAQQYSGDADCSIVARVRDALDIPVAISGDITSAEAFEERENCADAYMIGRGALSDPSIFDKLLGGTGTAKYPLIKRHIAYLAEYFSDHYGTVTIRKFFAYYLKGERGTREFKNAVMSAASLKDTRDLVDKYLREI